MSRPTRRIASCGTVWEQGVDPEPVARMAGWRGRAPNAYNDLLGGECGAGWSNFASPRLLRLTCRNQSITVGIGGAAGDGVASAGNTLVYTLARQGIGAYNYNAYQSVISRRALMAAGALLRQEAAEITVMR